MVVPPASTLLDRLFDVARAHDGACHLGDGIRRPGNGVPACHGAVDSPAAQLQDDGRISADDDAARRVERPSAVLQLGAVDFGILQHLSLLPLSSEPPRSYATVSST